MSFQRVSHFCLYQWNGVVGSSWFCHVIMKTKLVLCINVAAALYWLLEEMSVKMISVILLNACQNFLGWLSHFEKVGKMHGAFGIVLLFIFYANFAGLQILYTLLQNVAQEEAAAQSFYQTYFCDILQHIFSVVTDTSHTAGKIVSQMKTSLSNMIVMLHFLFWIITTYV